MRRFLSSARFGAVLLAFSVLAFNPNKKIPAREMQPWKIAYWIWAGDKPVATDAKAQILYVQMRGNRWPEDLPDADEYFVVYRIEPTEELTRERASRLIESYKALSGDAGDSVRVAGLQIDYDCPTSRLKSYADLLRWIRRDLPAGSRLSITALLDWFRPHTAIQEALAEVDEFVPQFYDAHSTRTIPDPGSYNFEPRERDTALTADETTKFRALERKIRDDQEEYWRAYQILNQIVDKAGRTSLGRRAARRAIFCLRRIEPRRFGREQEIRAADTKLSNWLAGK